MCNGGGFDMSTSAIVVGVVVVGIGAIITSPIWVSGAIIYGTAVGTFEGAKAAKRGVQYRRTTHVLKSVRKRLLKRMKAGEWQAYLQLLFERTRAEPSMQNLHELGVAMLIANDTMKAEQYLSAALSAPFSDRPVGGVQPPGSAWPAAEASKRKASVYFARGVVNQELRDYTTAVDDFTNATDNLRSAFGGADPLGTALAGEAIPQLTRAECLNHMGYAKFLNAMYKVVREDDFSHVDDEPLQRSRSGMLEGPPVLMRTKSSEERSAQALSLLQEAAMHFDEAIAATEAAPRGMFYFNRGKAKYFLALMSNMTQSDALVEASFAEAVINMDLMTEALSDFEFCVQTHNFGTTAEGHAMRAQALAVLGRMQEALQASALADQIDGKVFLVDLDSKVQLMTPWPLPQPPQDDAPHDFVETSFHRPHYCDHCLKLISLSFRNAACCQRCQFRVHRHCVDKAKKMKTCWKEKKSAGSSFVSNATQGKEMEAPASHVHVMRSTYFHKPTWCDACSRMCARPYGYKCIECRFRVHTKCVQGLPNCVVEGTENSLCAVSGSSDVDAGLRTIGFGYNLEAAAASAQATAPIVIMARALDGSEMTVRILTTDTLATLKKNLLVQMGSPFPVARLGLVFGELPLKSAADLLTAAEVGLEHGSTISAVMLDEEDAIEVEDVSAFDYLELKSSGVFLAPREAGDDRIFQLTYQVSPLA